MSKRTHNEDPAEDPKRIRTMDIRSATVEDAMESEVNCQMRLAGSFWQKLGRFELNEIIKSNTTSSVDFLLELVNKELASALDGIQNAQLTIIKLRRSICGQWLDDKRVPPLTGKASVGADLKLRFNILEVNDPLFHSRFHVGSYFRVLTGNSDNFKRSLRLEPERPMDGRFRALLEKKAMAKETLENLKDGRIVACHLDANQRRAVQMALNDDRKVVCIQGPPGSGKSHILLIAILSAIQTRKNDGKQMFIVLTPSHESYKNLVNKMKPLLRTMGLTHLHEHTFLDAQKYQEIIDECDEQKALEEQHNEMERKCQAGLMSYAEYTIRKKEQLDTLSETKTEEMMRNVRVIFSTIGSKFLDVIKNRKSFEDAIVFIDEAEQVKESETWPSLIRNCRIVMTGDTSQLSSLLMSEEAREFGLACSIMERVMATPENYSCVVLRDQHRSHNEITEWASTTFYGNEIKNKRPSVKLINFLKEKPEEAFLPLFDPLVLVDTSYESTPPLNMRTFEMRVKVAVPTAAGADISYVNIREGEIAVAHLMNLRRRGLKVEDIAILTPYGAQKDLIQKMMKEQILREVREGRPDPLEFDKLNIGTVESFQGQEYRAVIFSLVRSNPKFHLGFMQDLRRLNVAITRAKTHFLFIANGIMLQKSRDEKLVNLFNIFVRDKHRFPPSYVFGFTSWFNLNSTRTNFGMDLQDFLLHCDGHDVKMAEHCRTFVKNRYEQMAKKN